MTKFSYFRAISDDHMSSTAETVSFLSVRLKFNDKR